MSISGTLETVGLHCSQLQSCSLRSSCTYDNQILLTESLVEKFTRGCKLLTKLSLYIKSVPDKLFCYLGNHNPCLEKLAIYFDGTQNESISKESLQSFSNGCPLLNRFGLYNGHLSTGGMNYLVNHSVHLKYLLLASCKMFNDVTIIKKETDKLIPSTLVKFL